MKSKSSQRSNLPGRNHGARGVRQGRRDGRPLPTPIPSCFEGWLQEENTAENPEEQRSAERVSLWIYWQRCWNHTGNRGRNTVGFLSCVLNEDNSVQGHAGLGTPLGQQTPPWESLSSMSGFPRHRSGGSALYFHDSQPCSPLPCSMH